MDAHSIPELVKSPTPSVTLADTDLVVVKDHIDINVDDDLDVYYPERTFLEFVWNLERLHLGHLSRSQGVE